MCGIAGLIQLNTRPVEGMDRRLRAMSHLISHRGPDGEGYWQHSAGFVGFAHRRLSIIDLKTGDQPMSDHAGTWITYNGEVYNYIELRDELGAGGFKTTSDTEVILRAYEKWGPECLHHLRGMFSFALWDERKQELFCARDRFGIKPFYYTLAKDTLYFASEVKALLPFVPRIETDLEGLKDYLAFQFCLAGKTLFRDIHELLPGHRLVVKNGRIEVHRYWEVYYTLDWEHTAKYFTEHLRDLIEDSVRCHLRSDVQVGSYISGGIDSSIVSSVAARQQGSRMDGFHGKFSFSEDFDESKYARHLAEKAGITLHEIDITVDDFIKHMGSVVYHLDYPVAGPGSFPQFLVSQLARQHVKVVLGGQGGDETFGGYTRYLITYFEQCIKAAIDGSAHSGNFIVTYESIIPNLTALRNYKPLLQEFWREGLFDDMDRRYFRLINRASSLGREVNWELLADYSPFDTFRVIFNGANVGKESYFDKMTHFDFKTLLPALLQVEDRVSMAHGLESRVPFLDHRVVEFAATIPSNVKFANGTLKHALLEAMREELPPLILNRKDKMGFPTPITEWVKGKAKPFVVDLLSSRQALNRDIVNNRVVLESMTQEPKYGRKIWGFLCLEMWQREFHDREQKFKKLLEGAEVSV